MWRGSVGLVKSAAGVGTSGGHTSPQMWVAGRRSDCSARAGTKTQRDAAPRRGIRCADGQVQHDAAGRAHDAHTEFEQPEAERPHLHAGAGCARCAQSEFLHEHIRGGREEDAQLISPKAGATRAADRQIVVQFFDPVLDVASCAVDLGVQPLGGLMEIRHDEARVIPRRPSGVSPLT